MHPQVSYQECLIWVSTFLYRRIVLVCHQSQCSRRCNVRASIVIEPCYFIPEVWNINCLVIFRYALLRHISMDGTYGTIACLSGVLKQVTQRQNWAQGGNPWWHHNRWHYELAMADGPWIGPIRMCASKLHQAHLLPPRSIQICLPTEAIGNQTKYEQLDNYV